jgi:hypothetical protein
VKDEATAIQWLRQELREKPRSFQDIQPMFMREIQDWKQHEQTVELKELLRQNFLHYEGNGPVPSQIHSYLSSNFPDMRSREKDDPELVKKANDRWFVPDANKQADMDKVRDKVLLAEFDTYKNTRERRLKTFRLEAVRAGFNAAYAARDYKTIVSIFSKLPDDIIQADDPMHMFYAVACTRIED